MVLIKLKNLKETKSLYVALIKLKALEETKSFYKVELKKEGLTEMERNRYLSALKAIDRHIKGKQNFDKSKKFNEKGGLE